MKDGNLLNYGFNVNFMSDKYADFFLWRSPKDVYEPSPIANMGREANTFYIDPFFNFTNPNNNTSHKVKARFYYRGDNIADGSNSGKSITDILGNMGTDVNAITGIVQKRTKRRLQHALSNHPAGFARRPERTGKRNNQSARKHFSQQRLQPITATCFHG